MRIWLCVVAFMAVATPGFAQSDPQLTAFRMQFDFAKKYVTASAEKIPEDLYSFQPTPEVRTVARLLAHIADANYLFCSAGKGEKSPREMMSIEKSMEAEKKTKAVLQKELADSYAYCEAAFTALQPAQFAEKADFFGMPQTRLSMLAFATAHNFEHYGNLVTYMRIKNMVPPSTEQQQQQPPPPSN